MKKSHTSLLYLYPMLLILSCSVLMAQSTVKGLVTDNEGIPLPSATVVIEGTSIGTTTDMEGKFIIKASEGDVLVVSYVGFETARVTLGSNDTVTIRLQEGLSLEEIVMVGSRAKARSNVESAVPIDAISIRELPTQLGKMEVNQILKYVAPSFNATKQTGSDGADHIDPATLRGLGPDQTLVLVNGKRRHKSSLVNIFGTTGRGNSGTDLNAIPASAIKRIEILRDGAAAQYGSDAIAGVINIVLNDQTKGFEGSLSYGGYNTNQKGDFPEGTPNTKGNRLDVNKDGNEIGPDKTFDGGSLKFGGNYGLRIGKNGFVNLSSEIVSKNKTLRPGFAWRRGFGTASVDGLSGMLNMSVPVGKDVDLYAFVGSNYRNTDAYAFTRNDGERVVTAIYPDDETPGFTPRITSVIKDNSVSAGFRTKTNSGWNIDLNHTFGKNYFHYYIKGTLNASLVESSPTEFDAGGHSLGEHITGIDFSKNYEGVLQGLNVAFGGEYRIENFKIFAGEEASYSQYDILGIPMKSPTQTAPTVNVDGETKTRPGGSQGFPGYSIDNEVNEYRYNIALYLDLELDLTNQWLLNLAGRYEKYSDFGETMNYKFASRYKIIDPLSVRGSVSTGFRAPSLVQIHYNTKYTDFVGGKAVDKLLASNTSLVAQRFGIGRLQEEKSFNASVGFAFSYQNFSATIDGYLINVKDRIILTGSFDAKHLGIGVSSARFFVNGVDTKTKGVDIVLNWKKSLGTNQTLSFSLLGNINGMEITNPKNIINGTAETAQIFFGVREKYFVLASAPPSKFALSGSYKTKQFGVGLNLTRFGSVELVDYRIEDEGIGTFDPKKDIDIYNPKIVVDISANVNITENIDFTIGANNLFNTYPDQQADGWTEFGGYLDPVQMGINGAFYYGRIGFRFN